MAAQLISSLNPSNRLLLGVAAVLLLFPLAGLVAPDLWWGSHYLAFLPGYSTAICFGLAIGLLLVAALSGKRNSPIAFSLPRIESKWGYRLFAICLATLAATLFHTLAMANDPYGDAFLYFPLLEIEAETLDPDIYGRLFSLDFEPGQGRRTLLRIMAIVSHFTHLTYREAYLWLGTICGFAYVLSWLLFARTWLHGTANRWLGVILALGTPMVQVYCGHIESYGLVFLLLSWWVMALLTYINSGVRNDDTNREVEKGRKRVFGSGWLLVLLWLLGLRFHSFFLLMLPVVGLAMLGKFVRSGSAWAKLLTIKGMLLGVLLPLSGLGLLAYFFVFKDHADPRDLDDIENIQRLFLPIVPPEPPLDRYHLFSGWHLFDYLNMVLFWSLPAWLLILVSVFRKRIKIEDQTPTSDSFQGESFQGESAPQTEPKLRTQTKSGAKAQILLALLLMAGMLFMMNPLFSMPFDWDLFCICVPLLVGLGFVLLKDHQVQKNLVFAALGLSLFTLPVLLVNANETTQSHRIESAGKHVFKSYYLHSARFILFSLNFPQVPPKEHLKREEQIMAELKPYALDGKDSQYNEMLVNCANIANRLVNDPKKGIHYYLEAEKYGPMRARDAYNMMSAHLQLGEYREAQARAQLLLTVNYPSRGEALLSMVLTSLEAVDYPTAAKHATILLKENPKIPKMAEIIRRIQENDRVEGLVELFRE